MARLGRRCPAQMVRGRGPLFTPTFIGANSALSNSVAIPAHQVGDLLIIFDYQDGSTFVPTKPSAGGTVPAWTYIDNANGANANSSTTAYFVATATNTTTGLWSGGTVITAAVIRGVAATPIGGHAESGSTAAGSATAPSITLTNPDGSSMVLHFFGHRSGTGFTAWDAAPDFYTQQKAFLSGTGVCADTKNTATSAPSVTQTEDGSVNNGYRGATIEILSH